MVSAVAAMLRRPQGSERNKGDDLGENRKGEGGLDLWRLGGKTGSGAKLSRRHKSEGG